MLTDSFTLRGCFEGAVIEFQISIREQMPESAEYLTCACLVC